MKTVIWNSDDGFIPRVGEVHRNEEVQMPDDLADEFVKQGDAKLPKKALSKSKESEE